MLVFAQVLLAIGASFGFIGAGFVGGQWFIVILYQRDEPAPLDEFVPCLDALVSGAVVRHPSALCPEIE